MSTATLEDVRSASLDELAGLWDGEDDEDRAAALAEADRRDRAERRKRARDAERAEWELAVEAQYLDATRACKGRLLGRHGHHRAVTVERPAARAWTYASDELREYWEANPRVPTVAGIPRRSHARRDRAPAAGQR